MKREKTIKLLLEKQKKDLSEQYADKHKYLTERVKELEEKVVKAENLKDILTKITSMTINGEGFTVSGGQWHTSLTLPDNVLVYVDDILGGKVIKQEGKKCIVIDKSGTVKTGITKQNIDKGFSYKLVREY
jgi:hypothetical protein